MSTPPVARISAPPIARISAPPIARTSTPVAPIVAAPITEPSPPRHSYVAPVPAARAARPLPQGGPPPTIIRDLDALFAKDGRTDPRNGGNRTSAPTPPRASVPPQPAMQPAQFAQALLQKVAADFTPSRPPPPAPVPAIPASYAATFSSPSASPSSATVSGPRVVAFVPSPLTQLAMERTAELALPADDEDLAQLVPWYRRLWNKLFAR